MSTPFSSLTRGDHGLTPALPSPNTNRTPTLYYELEPTRLGGGGGTAGARVKDVRVRYTARHKCPGGGTYLDIAQVQVVIYLHLFSIETPKSVLPR